MNLKRLMFTRTLKLTLGLLLTLLSIVYFDSAVAQGNSKNRLVLAGWSKPITEITPLLVDAEKGFFSSRGLDLNYVPGAGGGDAIRNILSGQADVAFTDPGSFFMALSKGEKLLAIYDIYPQNVFNVVSLKSQNITKPSDLKGKRIGVYSLSSGTLQNLQVLLHQAGLKESDVSIVVTGLLNFAPLMQGQVDATAATDTGLLVGKAKGLGEVNVMEIKDHINISSDIFVVTQDTFNQKKDLLRRFLQAYKDSAQWMINNPTEAAQLATKVALDGQNQATNLEVIKLRNLSSVSNLTQSRGLGFFDVSQFQKAADIYKSMGIIDREIKASQVMSLELLPAK
jgi:NitT/TauT family transport system substrate-binding protein